MIVVQDGTSTWILLCPINIWHTESLPCKIDRKRKKGAVAFLPCSMESFDKYLGRQIPVIDSSLEIDLSCDDKALVFGAVISTMDKQAG